MALSQLNPVVIAGEARVAVLVGSDFLSATNHGVAQVAIALLEQQCIDGRLVGFGKA